MRQAIGDAFDFMWTNANLMYGSYKRTESYFENSDMKAKGTPDAAGTARCSTRSATSSAGRFSSDAYVPPKSDGSGQDRALLRERDGPAGEGRPDARRRGQ